MKCDFRLKTSDFRLFVIALHFWVLVCTVGAVSANPYEAIVGRNVFGLKPAPINVALPPPSPAAATTIKLLGISTILDRRQVMLKVTTAAHPPEPAKDKSYLMSEGQGEDDVEVLEINAIAGTVKIKNHDMTLSLDMKVDAEKPAVGTALPGPAMPNPQVPKLPGIPAPSTTALPPANPSEVSTMGGSGRTIPTRSLRTSATEGAGLGAAAASAAAAAEVAGQRSIEENVALYELNRAKNDALIQSGVKLPRMPPHVLIKPSE